MYTKNALVPLKGITGKLIYVFVTGVLLSKNFLKLNKSEISQILIKLYLYVINYVQEFISLLVIKNL